MPSAAKKRAGLLLAALVLGASCSETLPLEGELALLPARLEEAPVQLAHVYFRDREDLQQLALELDLLEAVDHERRWVAALLSPEESRALRERGYRVEVQPEATERLNAPWVPLAGQVQGIPGYPCYRTVEETYEAMAQIAARYPQLATWQAFGASWDRVTPGGRPGYELRVLVLGNRATPGPKPRFVLMAAIHAREYTTAELAARYAEHLVARYGTDPDVTWMLDHFEAHIIFHANPDGRKLAEQGLSQRKNLNNTRGTCSNPPTTSSQHGVDLNRNSSILWEGSGSSTSACSLTYRGPSPASEPETRAVESYLVQVLPDQREPGLTAPAPEDATGVFISLHSFSELVLFPWGGSSSPAPNQAGLQTLGRRFGFFNRYRVCQPPVCLYAANGTTDDFAYGELGVASYTFELGTAFFESCSTFESTVLPANLPALVYALKSARRPYQTPSGPDSLALQVTPATVIEGQTIALSGTADDTRFGSNGGVETSQPIAAARYSVDAPSWVAGTSTYPLVAADGAFNSVVEPLRGVVDTTGWTPGRHTLFVESRDSSGAWGPPTAIYVTVREAVYGVGVTPATAEQRGLRQEVVEYELVLSNQGNVADTYTVSLVGAQWPATASATQVGPLAPGARGTVRVAVQVPADAEYWSTDSVQVVLTSRARPSRTATARLTTTAVSTDQTAPESLVLWPAPGALLAGSVTLSASAWDNVGVTRVDFYAGELLVGSASSKPYEVVWDTTKLPDGEYRLTARAQDEGRNSSRSREVVVYVSNGRHCYMRDELLVNGGFEQGAQGWSVQGTGVIESDPGAPARSGQYKASLLGYGEVAAESLAQAIEVPASACSARVRFHLRVLSEEPTATPADTLGVMLVDAQTGEPLLELGSYSNSHLGGQYVEHTFDVGGLRGRRARLVFQAREDAKYPTTFLVDDVSAEVLW